MTDRSSYLRGQLASIGILLDDPIVPAPPAAPAPVPTPPDRAHVRAILTAAGAPERDLDWLTASCPSLEAAYAYRPPHVAR